MIDGVFAAFGVALALLVVPGLDFGVSFAAVGGVFVAAVGVRFGLLALTGGNDAGDFSKNREIYYLFFSTRSL
jgi:hypothetical protein